MDWDAFFTLHADLPREGPGSDELTRRALGMLGVLPSTPRVLDLGCGPGRQTLVLARELNTVITGVDSHQPFLDQLARSAAAEGLAQLVRPLKADFSQTELLPQPVDLIWSEGAVYLLGFAEGLALWRSLLADGGAMVVSNAAWLTDERPAEAEAFWATNYPLMTDAAGDVANARSQGFDVLGHFPLPASEWFESYLNPLEERMRLLAPKAEVDSALAEVIAEQAVENELCRRHGHSFGYVYYVLRKA